MEKFYKKGAEAEIVQKIFNGQKAISKNRIKKNYRDSKLDLFIRKKRTRSEIKLIKAASKVTNVPQILNIDEEHQKIVLQFIDGPIVKDVINKKIFLCEIIGKEIKKIHEVGIIHGDLTTSNMIYFKDKTIQNHEKIFFIDFGLGYFSKKIEDQATDLIVFKKTFNSTHSSISGGWDKVMKGYCPSQKLLIQMQKIEKRARYH